jgi:hypothetical protein
MYDTPGSERPLRLADEVAQVPSCHDQRVIHGAPECARVRTSQPPPTVRPAAVRSRRLCRDIGRSGEGAILARRISGQLEEDVVERGPPQGQVAHGDALPAKRGRRIGQQLETVAADRARELVRSLRGLRIAAANRGERLLGALPVGGVAQLDLQDLAPYTILELVARTLRDHSPVVDHRDPVGELVGLLEVLGGEQHRRPLAHEVADRAPDLVSAAWIQPGRGLIEKQHRGVREQARRQVEPPAHPTGVGSRRSIGGVGEVEAIEQLGRPPAGLDRCEVEEPSEHLQVLPPGQQLVHCRELPGETDELAHRGRVADDVLSKDLGVAGIRPEKRGENADERRLACSVRSQQAEDRALLDLNGHPGEGDCRSEAL